MTNNKIVLFTQLYSPDITTTAIIMTDLAEDLVSNDLDIGVVSAQPTYLVKDLCSKKEVRNGVSIKRIWSFNFDKNRNIGRILNSASCFLSMFFAMFSTKSNDLLVFNTNPALLPCLGYIIAIIRQQPYVILIHDLWPELPANVGMIKEGGFIFRCIDFFLTLSYKRAKRIVVLSEAMKEVIAQKVPRQSNNIHVLHNWADTSRVYPVAAKENSYRQELEIGDKKVVMYSGNLGRYQPIDVMMEAARILRNRTDILFVFKGDGAKRKEMEDTVAKQRLTNVIFLPFHPIDKLAMSLSIADISLMGMQPENEGVIMPSKLYGLLAVGKPIICITAPESELAGLLAESGAGVQTAPDSGQEMTQHILSILDTPEKAKEMGRQGREYFLKHFERKIVTRQWVEMLKDLVA